MIIDFHTHSFPDQIAARVARSLSHMSHSAYYICPDITSLTDSMKTAGIDFSVNLPVVTKVEQTTSVNNRMIDACEKLFSLGIICFGGIHPDYPDCISELRRLKGYGIRGIKLHPPYQGMDLNDIRMKRILGAASCEGMTVVVHAGLDIGLQDRNYASIPMILDVINDVHPEKLVLAHFGGWQGWQEFEKDLAGAPVYVDTAFSLGNITPAEGEEGLLTHTKNLSVPDFVRLSRLHGTDRILFATDSPWASQKEYVEIIENSTLSAEEKEDIFFRNAARILNLKQS